MIFPKKEILGLLICFATMLMMAEVNAGPYKYKPDTSQQQTNIEIVKDSPIIAMLDSLSHYTFTGFTDYADEYTKLNKYNYQTDFIPSFSDTVVQNRLKSLSEKSPFEFSYNNQVRQFIDLYAVKRRALTQRILGLSKIYFPLFEEMLDKYNLPLELKYLAVIESALNPVAKSTAGAKGLWQFMYHTGKIYDLNVTSYIDERGDPYKSTEAACRHMQDLYCIYKDWSLVLAAYNSGAGNVNKAIRRSGGAMDYWLLQRYLPRETRDYVPAFIAATYVMHYAAEYNLFPVHQGITAADIDSVAVKQILSFEQISAMLNISMENIRFLNPSYIKGIIPSNNEKVYFLRLPRTYIADFINNEAAVYAYKTQKMQQQEKYLAQQLQEDNDQTVRHIVKKGETLAKIARKYNCSTSEIKRWNHLRSNYVRSRQELIVSMPAAKPPKEVDTNKTLATRNSEHKIKTAAPKTNPVNAAVVAYVPEDTINYHESYPEFFTASSAHQAKTRDVKKPRILFHTVRPGDTLWSIASKYNGITVDKIKMLNNIKNAKSIKPGQKIKISVEG